MLVQAFPSTKSCGLRIPRRSEQDVSTALNPAPTAVAACIGMAVMLVLSPTVPAAEWYVTPALKLTYEQNDNIRMTLQPHNTVRGSTVAPRLDMGTQSELWFVSGSAEVARKRYSGEQGLDRDDEIFRIGSGYRGERSNLTVNASRVNDAVISGELEDPDLGFVTIQKSRRTENVEPSWIWFLTERSQLQLGYQLSEVSYMDGASVGLYDYRWRAATATWSYMMQPLSQFFFTASYSKYRVPDISLQSQIPATGFGIGPLATDVDSSSPSFRMGVSHTFSETTQATVALGRRKTSIERTLQDCLFVSGVIVSCGLPRLESTEDSGTTFSVDLTNKYEAFEVTAKASRDIAASGTGTEVETDLLRVQVVHPVSARLSSSLSVSGSDSRRIAGVTGVTSTISDVKQYSVQPALDWKWTREASLSTIYRYNHLERENETQAVQSHVVYLTLVYVWPRFSTSP